MKNLEAQKLIDTLKDEVTEISEDLQIKIYNICENLDYTNSSRFSYNIDRLKQFAKELNDFKITNHGS
jgi:hypothetical protein